MNKLAVIPKDKKGGIVTGTIFGIGGLLFGIGGLLIAVIVILLITSNVGNAGLISNDATYTFTVTNESITAVGTGMNVLTTYIANSEYWSSWNATRVMNGSVTSLTNETLVEGVDYVIYPANGSISNLTKWSQNKARITFSWTKIETNSNDAVSSMRANFTSGIDNVSSKLPTILLIVAVVFIFGALVLLVREAQNMGIGGSGNQGSL